MSTYLIENEIKLTRQEGDNSDIIFTIPEQLSLSFADAIFQVKDRYKRTIIGKTTVDDTIIITITSVQEPILDTDGNSVLDDQGNPTYNTIITQTLTIPLLPNDTKTFSGSHRWELQLTDKTPGGYGVKTVAKGVLEIKPELIA